MHYCSFGVTSDLRIAHLASHTFPYLSLQEFASDSRFKNMEYTEEACRRYELFVSLQQEWVIFFFLEEEKKKGSTLFF